MRLFLRTAAVLAATATLAACQAATPAPAAQAEAAPAAADAQVDTALSEIRARQFDPVTGKARAATTVFAGPAQPAAAPAPSGALGDANVMSGTLQGLTSDAASDGPAL